MLERANPLERENRMLRERVGVLEETVRQYEERERLTVPLPPGMPSLTPHEETILRGLLRGDVQSRDRLYFAMYGGDGDTFDRIVDVHLTRLRRKIEPLGYKVVNHWGRGWHLERPQ